MMRSYSTASCHFHKQVPAHAQKTRLKTTLLSVPRTIHALKSYKCGSIKVPCATSQAEEVKQLATTVTFVDRFLISLVRATVKVEFVWLAISELARYQILSVAEKWDLKVDSYSEELKKYGVEEALATLRDENLKYPEYYLQKFHACAEGNLSWRAAFEAKYAWMALSLTAAQRRSNCDPSITIQEASERWAQDASSMVAKYLEDNVLPEPVKVLDAGCSTGYSSRNLKRAFPGMQITGVDASPYFLAVAETEEKIRGAEGSERITFRHAVFEELQQEDSSVDMVYFQFMFHECPTAIIEANLARAARLVKPGGIVAFADINPYATALSRLPPPLKALREGTEPWLYQYEQTDFEAAFRKAGLVNIRKYAMDERHMGLFAQVPA